MRLAPFFLFLAATGQTLTLDPARWQATAQRAEIAPRTWREAVHKQAGPGSLAISGASNSAVYGGWSQRVGGVAPGAWYRLRASYSTTGLVDEPQHVLARLDWREAGGKRAGQPEFGTRTASAGGGWRQVEILAPAPSGAAAVTIELLLAHAPQATVYWDSVTLERVAAPAARPVRVVSVRLRPRRSPSAEASVTRFIEHVNANVKEADLIVLPEAIPMAGTGRSYLDVAETVPGPTTARLGETARAHHSYLVAGLIERDGQAAYNTAVLLDRQGRLVGRYRKVYLPREEIEGGLTPGSEYPVFDTDFGRLGLMICWDIQYADPARALALQRAEVLAMPIAGGNLTLGKARAIENHLFIVSSGYDYPTMVVDPDGETVANADSEPGLAVATIDLNKRYPDAWLGLMRARFFHELRTDIAMPAR